MTVGELRELIKGLPDSAEVHPDWADGCALDDSEPGVKLIGMDVRRYKGPESEYLAVLVELFYLDEDEEEFDTLTCQECGGDCVVLDNGVSHHVEEDGHTDHDQDADHVAVPEKDQNDD